MLFTALIVEGFKGKMTLFRRLFRKLAPAFFMGKGAAWRDLFSERKRSYIMQHLLKSKYCTIEVIMRKQFWHSLASVLSFLLI
jgi:hypothetical protein